MHWPADAGVRSIGVPPVHREQQLSRSLGAQAFGIVKCGACRATWVGVTSAELVYERPRVIPSLSVILGGQCFGCHHWCGGGWVGFGRDDADSAFGEQFEAHVAATFGPFVVLFG